MAGLDDWDERHDGYGEEATFKYKRQRIQMFIYASFVLRRGRTEFMPALACDWRLTLMAGRSVDSSLANEISLLLVIDAMAYATY